MSTITATIVASPHNIARLFPLLAAVCRSEPSPGNRKSLSPSTNISQAIRKNHPPATDIIEFQTSPIVEKGRSNSVNLCHLLNPMFHTCPVKIRMIDPNSTPSCLLGNSATIASITPGRKLSTGIDCKISSSGIKIISARLEVAAAYPYASANARLSAYATRIRTSEYSAYSGKLHGFCDISASTRTGPNHDFAMEYTPNTAANTQTNTPMSIRNPQPQRDPNGRLVADGSGVSCSAVIFGAEGTDQSAFSAFGQRQFSAGRVVIEKFRVASPLDRRLQLPLRFVLAEMLVQQILEKFRGQRPVRLGLQRLLHLPQQRHIGHHRLTKNLFSFLNVRLCECRSFRRNNRVAFFQLHQSQQHCGLHRRQQRIHFQAQPIRQHMQIRMPALLIRQNLQQSRRS